MMNLLKEEVGGKLSSTRTISLSIVGIVGADVVQVGLSELHVYLIGIAVAGNVLGGAVEKIVKNGRRTRLRKPPEPKDD